MDINRAKKDKMESNHNTYVSPLSTRYASKEMLYIFSDQHKFSTWRKLWIMLAKAEQVIVPIQYISFVKNETEIELCL